MCRCDPQRGTGYRVERTSKLFQLLIPLALSACLNGAAHAAEADCTGSAPCPAAEQAAPAAAPTWRESVDKAREDLAASLFGVQLSAFGDVQSSYGDSGGQKMNWGSFELDAAGDFSHDLQGAMAAVNTPEGTTIAVGFLDYHTFGGRIAPRGRLWAGTGLHVQVGRFDVPFGNDWQFFASKDSVSISRPLTTDLVMGGGYNDTGIRVLGNNGSTNFNAFLLRGFNSGRLIGGRLGLTPFSALFSFAEAREPKGVELGLSYFYDASSSWQKKEAGWATDAEVRHGNWDGRFEYMVRRKEPVPGDVTVLRGWHFTQEYALGEMVAWPTTLFARYEQDAVQPAEIVTLGAEAGDARDVRVAAGFSTNLGRRDLVLWKVEAQHYRAATPTTRALPGYAHDILWFTQLVLLL